jgi:diadenosine tetraphosphate (Ap4A) HIT family hydrolase
VLLRLDAFPGARAGADRLDAAARLLRATGIPFLLTVLPRVPEAGDGTARRRHAAAEADRLDELRRDPGVAFGAGGLDGRPLDQLEPAALEAALDEADAVLARYGIAPDVLVAPGGRVHLRRFRALAERYTVICGGPGSVDHMGFHRTPLWRGDAVWMPTYAPLAGPPGEVARGLRSLAAREAALWLPAVLELADLDEDALRDVAEALTGLARPWDEFLAAARAARASADARS